uniref:Type II secretion system protein L n=1 Tax=Candidatus Kentrum sp. FW TaxID=2126338 RepID=A0A450S432_9GAMM|nr:MAG: type II secretion system protein L [Candidatus Kentron sp. FW]VFJ48000.1 MAG: type II secretion system protein L [Candidatus Kentron sp. FW]
MSDRLFIRFHSDDEAGITWLRQGAIPGEIISRTGTLSDLSGQSADCQVIVFVPGSDVLLLMADVPPMNRQRIQTAVPFALEDHLITNIESLHFAFGKQSSDGLISVAVVADDLMSIWLSRLEQVGIRPDILIPETLALPLAPDAWTILMDMDGGLIRSGTLSGFAVELPNLVMIISHELDASEAPKRIRLLHCTQRAVEENIPALEFLGCEVMEEAYGSDRIEVLCAHFDEQRAINLLQGKYKRESGKRIWRAWKIPVALLAVWFLAWVTGVLLDITRLSEQSRLLDDKIGTVYRQAFPDARNMSNLRVRMKRSLDELDKSGAETVGFLDLLGKASVHLQSVESLQLTNIYFRSGALELRMKIDDLQAFDGIKANLVKTGLMVEVLSVTTHEDTVMARLKISNRDQTSAR